MSLLRHCRVNAALTIQLFSQLFHYISARSLNVILNTQSLCCKKWGIRLVTRMTHITRWAESQGLELAAECHLARIQQCAHLLQVRIEPEDRFILQEDELLPLAALKNHSYKADVGHICKTLAYFGYSKANETTLSSIRPLL